MKKILLSCCFLLATLALAAQNLVSVTFLGSKTQAQLTAEFNVPFIQFGARYYRVTYTTLNLAGQPDTVSGLISVPDNAAKVYPRLVYQHGTSGSTQDVPSVNVLQGGEGRIGWLFAGLGYVALMPDYLGLGVSDDVFHPYVHAESEASVALDMLRALPAFADQYQVHVNSQLFVTGYSQGGHAAMALQRAIELDPTGEFDVTASAPMSGPYSIGEVMRALILSDEVYYYPAYIPNTALSYQTAYGNIFSQLTDIFKPVYAAPIQQFYLGNMTLSDLNTQLISLLVANEGACIPTQMIQPDVLAAVQADPEHPINQALRANDVYHWAPQAPTRLFYCMSDDQVPFENSLLARDTMQALGAADLLASDVSPSSNHGECVVPALTQTLFFFLAFQQIGTATSTSAPLAEVLTLSPNPADESFTFDNGSAQAVFKAYTADGRLCWQQLFGAGAQQINVQQWPSGNYWIQVQTAEGLKIAQLLVRH